MKQLPESGMAVITEMENMKVGKGAGGLEEVECSL